jgi:Sad1 / UNC-like C-terminal
MPAKRATRSRATPARGSATAATRRTTQGNTPSRTTVLESTPLPDVEAEQSFAYGSSNTKLLPQQLVPQKKMTIKQMAETLDAGIRAAERNFEAQEEEAAQYGRNTAETRAERARRRSESRDSRASSVISEPTPVPPPRSRRERGTPQEPQTWLEDIPEETVRTSLSPSEPGSVESELSSPIDQHTPTPPPPEESSLPPPTNIDQTYSQERGIHTGTDNEPPADLRGKFRYFIGRVGDVILNTRDIIRWHVHFYTFDDFLRHAFKLGMVMSIVFIFFCSLVLMGRTMCDWYCETPLAHQPSSPWHQWINNMCKYSTDQRFSGGDTSIADTPGTRASAMQIASLISDVKYQNTKILEMQQKYEKRDMRASSTISSLQSRESELISSQSVLVSSLVAAHSSASAAASAAAASSLSSNSQQQHSHPYALTPIFKRINYASPALGAIINPHITSPTKTKHFPFLQRLLLSAATLKKYQSKPPIEALKPWTEVGDCWCAAAIPPGAKGRTYIQLGIWLGHEIFPDEIVIEHLPLGTTPSPGSAPKDISIWADLGHLSAPEFEAINLPRDRAHGTQFALLGKVRYNAKQNEEGMWVQTFRLAVNQQHRDEIALDKLAIRVAGNWGREATHTCLYRVRVHGVPVRPHPEIVRDEGAEGGWKLN